MDLLQETKLLPPTTGILDEAILSEGWKIKPISTNNESTNSKLNEESFENIFKSFLTQF